jgi:hypothetical protein
MIALRAVFTVAILAVAVSLMPAGPSAEAQQAQCDGNEAAIDCNVEILVPGESGSENSNDDASTGSSGRRGRAVPTIASFGLGGNRAGCGRSTVTGAEAAQQRGRLNNGPSTGETTVCGQGQDPGADPTSVRILPEGQEVVAAPPAPEDVATGLFLEAQAEMRRPEVVMDPPVGTASIISLPVFVQVTNWVGGFTRERCDQGVCVSLSAEPTLTFDPGEPGSEPIVCEPPGTRFDPNGADPEVQAAAPGACAHAYRARTGADERPEAWPGQVTVTWDVSWTAGGASGEFDPQALSTALPREVDEVQTVVRDGAG